MTALLIALVVCGSAIYVAHRVLLALASKAQADHALAERRLRLDEDYLALERERLDNEKHKAALPKARADMPPDLEARVNGWEDDWAREDERRALMEMYAEYGDWDIVRRKYSPSLADSTADTQVI